MAGSADVTHEGHDGHDKPQHDFHLVDPSPWPLIGAGAALLLVIGGLMYMHDAKGGHVVLLLGFVAVLYVMFHWWREVLRESKHGDHKAIVNTGLRIGMVLFILSEVLFFFSFFWAFFWSALVPPDLVSVSWPPAGIEPADPWDIPLLNTMLLLLSGASVTWAHHAMRENDQKTAFRALLITVLLGLTFTSFQVYEYVHLIHDGFNITSWMYGSTFFMATGFHGFHVIIGTTFLIVCMFRAYQMKFQAEHHVGFEAASWYWHFVDVVWLFLFICVYVWGGSLRFMTAVAS